MERKTAKQFKNDLSKAETKVELLKGQIRARFISLGNQYPDVQVGQKSTHSRQKVLTAGDVLSVVQHYPIPTLLHMIGVIEKHIADQHPHQQQDLFPGHKTSVNAVRIPNPEIKDKRDV